MHRKSNKHKNWRYPEAPHVKQRVQKRTQCTARGEGQNTHRHQPESLVGRFCLVRRQTVYDVCEIHHELRRRTRHDRRRRRVGEMDSMSGILTRHRRD